MSEDRQMTADDLRRAGEARFGARWQRPMARYLGEHHPSGARQAIDDRLVRRWAAGERPVPEWAIGVLRDGPQTTVVTGAPVAYTKLLDALYLIRERYPRMSIAGALILTETIEARGGIAKADLTERIAGSRDTSSLDASIRHLADLGLLRIERPAANAVIIRLGRFFG